MLLKNFLLTGFFNKGIDISPHSLHKGCFTLPNMEIENRGLTCPQPVLNTKKALEELSRQGIEDYVLTAIVDNDAAKENVAHFAAFAGL